MVTKRLSFRLILLTLFGLAQYASFALGHVAEIEWQLPNGQDIEVTWTDTIQTDALALYGTVSDDPNSVVTYTQYNEAIEISIESLKYGTYAYDNATATFIPMDYQTSANDALITKDNDVNIRSIATSNTDTLPLIDILVVYTKETKVALGGIDQVIAKAKQCVNNSNNVFRSSKINTQSRLVQVAEINYRTGNILANELGYMRSKTDGKMDEIHDMRDKAGADVVCLLTDKDTQRTRGMAYILSSENGSPDNAFTVNYYSTAHGVYPHEIGHTLGCNHNISIGGPALYYNSFGHHFSHKGETRGTMMSYIGKRCARFAGIDTFWEGTVTGVDSVANTVSTINRSGYIVAQYRQSKRIMDATVSLENNTKDSLQCTVANRYAAGSSALELDLDLPNNVTVKSISTVDEVTLSNGVIYIDSIARYGKKVFTIALDMTGVDTDKYDINATVKNASDLQVDFNPSNDSYMLEYETASHASTLGRSGIKVINTLFDHELRVDVKQSTAIDIYDINGKLQLNTTIHASAQLGASLANGVYFVKASSGSEVKTFKVIKY